MTYERSFLTTFVLISPIVTMVVYFIQGDLVVSLGLVGSLSIIRFRTPIKDTRDMVFLFWSIAVGLGAGTGNWTITIVASIIVARSEEHTSELQSRGHLVCRLLLEKKKNKYQCNSPTRI